MPWRARARPVAIVALLALALGAWGTRAWPQDAPPPTEPEIPAPAGLVNDRAGVMDEPTRARLEAFLDQLREKTGAEFAILTVKTTAPLSPSEYKVRVFERWGMGRKGHDDGLLMLVAVEEREVRFEPGYGLEGTLPDGLQSRIFRDQMAPRFREGDFAGGIVAGTLACAQRIAAEKGVTLEWDGRELHYDASPRRHGLPLWAAVLALVLLMILFSRIGGGFGGPYRPRGGGWMYPRGSGYWGGGFGGLGGLGGGGFAGRSFGGFGGGASGGGGGGGKW